MGKNMMFDLVIQASGKPVDNSVFGRKIDSGFELMNCP
jgi:hypothetical protein